VSNFNPELSQLNQDFYPRYKKLPDGGFKAFPLKLLTVLGVTDKVATDISITTSLTKMIASGVNMARDLVGAPPNSKTPLIIAELAKKLASDHGLTCTVLGEEECKARNMGGYLGVQQGSKFPPQFIHLTYRPVGVADKDLVKVALVGKGLTFDSGGYNLKVGAGSMIELMKFDMGGCGAVLGCAKAISQLKPKNVEVHFITAVCENMISDEAMRPGDILTASNGKTIEVINTDAEGRLTLSDALVYADALGPEIIIDLATLTGACIVALGEKVAAGNLTFFIFIYLFLILIKFLQCIHQTKNCVMIWRLPAGEQTKGFGQCLSSLHTKNSSSLA
jgi:leucyl aminopeptidase